MSQQQHPASQALLQVVHILYTLYQNGIHKSQLPARTVYNRYLFAKSLRPLAHDKHHMPWCSKFLLWLSVTESRIQASRPSTWEKSLRNLKAIDMSSRTPRLTACYEPIGPLCQCIELRVGFSLTHYRSF